jgi:hypothetical protein
MVANARYVVFRGAVAPGRLLPAANSHNRPKTESIIAQVITAERLKQVSAAVAADAHHAL